MMAIATETAERDWIVKRRQELWEELEAHPELADALRIVLAVAAAREELAKPGAIASRTAAFRESAETLAGAWRALQ